MTTRLTAPAATDPGPLLPITARPPGLSTTGTQELKIMLMHEILARSRMREDQHRAQRERMARRLAAARRWRRLARYADRRAHRLTVGL